MLGDGYYVGRVVNISKKKIVVITNARFSEAFVNSKTHHLARNIKIIPTVLTRSPQSFTAHSTGVR